ncbi:hypothetical protein B0T21DRAFT_159131 [Apiosordaria backusii]|uniref:Uncharacterized protein n=1 Tax=Apiosordaria backusii TaxID=314023 RepID=A0AA40EG37_9PEZI|nr:hypothetical protein B0T21DRAFT_159131 [Apiosordaria backusii]
MIMDSSATHRRHTMLCSQFFDDQPPRQEHHRHPLMALTMKVPCKRIGAGLLWHYLEQQCGPGNYSVEVEQNVYIIHTISTRTIRDL